MTEAERFERLQKLRATLPPEMRALVEWAAGELYVGLRARAAALGLPPDRAAAEAHEASVRVLIQFTKAFKLQRAIDRNWPRH